MLSKKILFFLIFETETLLLEVQKELNEHQIFPRRYFYPSLNTILYLEYIKIENSEDISKRILCLPLFKDLNLFELQEIINIINL